MKAVFILIIIQLYPRGRSRWYSLASKLVESDVSARNKMTYTYGGTETPERPARTTVTVLTELNHHHHQQHPRESVHGTRYVTSSAGSRTCVAREGPSQRAKAFIQFGSAWVLHHIPAVTCAVGDITQPDTHAMCLKATPTVRAGWLNDSRLCS